MALLSPPGPVPGAAGSAFRPRFRVPSPLAAAAAAVVLAAGAGCRSLDPLPLRPEPIPYADTLPIREPEEQEPAFLKFVVNEAVGAEAGEAIDVRRWAGKKREALNLTHFDDVVNSAWFTHRNGREPMSLEEIARGAASAPGPDTSRALTVVAAKPEGIMPGFTIRDARGDRYLFKFDPKGNPLLASSADIVASRLFHAAGYHVPADYMTVFDSASLVLEPEATITMGGRERPMTRADIRRVLERTDARPDGRFLALASRFVPGTPKGPFRFEGRREDDPNDHYEHQYRRELRGLYVLSAWLNHIDMRYENTLDTYIDPPGYLRHYLIDFASCLGSGGIRAHNPREGKEYNFDFWPTWARVFTLGFYTVGWEGEEWEEIHPAIGWLSTETFEPGSWNANWPNAAFTGMSAADGYWGAKLVGSFTDEQLRAATGAAALPPEAADTLAKILAVRRDRTVAHWFARVTPVEDPAVAGPAEGGGFVLEFSDSGMARGLWRRWNVAYRWEFEDEERGLRWRGEAPAAGGGRQRLVVGPGGRPAPVTDRPAGSGIAVLRVRAIRTGDADGREARIYLRREGTAGYRVVALHH